MRAPARTQVKSDSVASPSHHTDLTLTKILGEPTRTEIKMTQFDVSQSDWTSVQVSNLLENLIAQLSASSTPAEAIAAIEAIAAYRTPEAIPPLIEALSHHHPGVRAAATSHLVQLASLSLEALIFSYYTTTDQGVQAHIIQALAQIGDCKAIAVLEEVVGVSVANHCQGNVRRIAARGLGKIGSTAIDAQTIHRAVDKLSWALRSPEDWALRYAAALSLAEIGTPEAIAMLQQALTQESDRVVQIRIRMALVERSGVAG